MENKKKKKKKKISSSFYTDKRSKKSFYVYMILRILVIISALFEIANSNYTNTFFCIVALVLFSFPNLIENTLKIEFPTVMESMIYVFIYAAWILGELNNFYEIFPYWDTILHTINGFLCAGLGFSFIDILNKRSQKFNLSPLYLALAAFSFSMTIGVMWEFFEFSMDRVFLTDMQKDEIVETISTVTFDETKSNTPVKIKDIEKTIITTKDGKTIEVNGYLDVGLYDTIEDLFVNVVGAVTFILF